MAVAGGFRPKRWQNPDSNETSLGRASTSNEGRNVGPDGESLADHPGQTVFCSGEVLRWGFDRQPTAVTRLNGLTSVGGSVRVGVGGGCGGCSGRSDCRWIGAPCICRWRSSGREDMWVVSALGVGLCS